MLALIWQRSLKQPDLSFTSGKRLSLLQRLWSDIGAWDWACHVSIMKTEWRKIKNNAEAYSSVNLLEQYPLSNEEGVLEGQLLSNARSLHTLIVYTSVCRSATESSAQPVIDIVDMASTTSSPKVGHKIEWEWYLSSGSAISFKSPFQWNLSSKFSS